MPNGYLRASGESIPGNETNSPTLSTKKLFPPLQSFAPKTGTKPLSRDDELRNLDMPLSMLPEAYDPTWDLSQRMYPDSLGFWLKMVCGAPESTAGNGTTVKDLGEVAVPVGATRHRWTAPFGPTGASPLTAQLDVAYKDQGVFYKMKGAACESLAIANPESGGATLSASGPALYLDAQSDPSLTAVYEALTIAPFMFNGLTLPKNLTGSAILDATGFTIAINNPVEPVRTAQIASRWADVMEKGNSGPINVSGAIPKRLLDEDDIKALRDATGFELMAQWISQSIIASSYPYKFTMLAKNAQYSDGDPDALQNQRRLGNTLSWRSTAASTESTTFELVNATASYV